MIREALAEPGLDELIEALALRRLALNITQQELDAIIGVAEGQVAKWETGVRRPKSHLLGCWLRALDCHLTIVVNDKPPPHE